MPKQVGHHFITETSKMDVEHVRTDLQLVDILIKGLERVKLVEMRPRLKVKEVKSKS
jgi:hypothetical protein